MGLLSLSPRSCLEGCCVWTQDGTRPGAACCPPMAAPCSVSSCAVCLQPQGFECSEAGRGENWPPRDLGRVQGVGRGQLPTPVSALGVPRLVGTVSAGAEAGRTARRCLLFHLTVFSFAYLPVCTCVRMDVLFCFALFLPYLAARGILVPRPGIKPVVGEGWFLPG